MAFIGRHVSIAGSMDLAFDRAKALDCTAMQIFVTNPRGWKLSPVGKDSEAAFRKKGSATGIVSVAHMPYLPNIASSNKDSFSKSVESLVENIERCDKLNIAYLVTHMGSHLSQGKEKGIENVVQAVSTALERSKKVKILLENEAGHKNSVGDKIEDLVKVSELVRSDRLGFCLDTCHLFASGYDITTHEVLDNVFGLLSIDKVFAIHLNDAKKELGSRLDRHANIGYGYIRVEGFRSFLNYKGIAGKAIILETPVGEEISEADEITLVKSLLP